MGNTTKTAQTVAEHTSVPPCVESIQPTYSTQSSSRTPLAETSRASMSHASVLSSSQFAENPHLAQSSTPGHVTQLSHNLRREPMLDRYLEPKYFAALFQMYIACNLSYQVYQENEGVFGAASPYVSIFMIIILLALLARKSWNAKYNDANWASFYQQRGLSHIHDDVLQKSKALSDQNAALRQSSVTELSAFLSPNLSAVATEFSLLQQSLSRELNIIQETISDLDNQLEDNEGKGLSEEEKNDILSRRQILLASKDTAESLVVITEKKLKKEQMRTDLKTVYQELAQTYKVLLESRKNIAFTSLNQELYMAWIDEKVRLEEKLHNLHLEAKRCGFATDPSSPEKQVAFIQPRFFSVPAIRVATVEYRSLVEFLHSAQEQSRQTVSATEPPIAQLADHRQDSQEAMVSSSTNVASDLAYSDYRPY